MSDLYIIWFKEKCFLECLCMNLNFKLFLFFFFFIKSTDLFWEKSYVNIWFISYPGNKRFMCGYSIKSNDCDSSTQIWISALWMYYSSVLKPVECSSAWLFNFLRCHFLLIYYFLLSHIFNFGHNKNLSPETAAVFVAQTQLCTACTHNPQIFIFYFLCFGSHLNVHWIRPQTQWFIDTCCIRILRLISKHCRSVTLSKCLLMTLVLWCISYHHFMLMCVSIIVPYLAKTKSLGETDDSFLLTVSFI